MKNTFSIVFTVIVLAVYTDGLYSQNIAITDDNAYTAQSSAMLDVKSLTKGLLVPRLTSAQRNAISLPATGLLVFDTNENIFYYYTGSTWSNLSVGQLWTKNGNYVYLSNTDDNVGIGVTAPDNKLLVKADASTGVDESIFAVLNNAGDTVFAVYQEGVRIWVNNDGGSKANGSRGGFAVGGFNPAKAGFTNEYLRVTPDSVRVYIDETYVGAKANGSRGGFAVGGFNPAKGTNTENYMIVSLDTTETIVPSEPRILWYPTKEAFLTGRVIIESKDSIGINSFASGFESKAIGNYSQALGYHARAFGNNSTAIGNNANAEGDDSYSLGNFSKTENTGSYAIGSGARASGLRSFALGSTGVDSAGTATSATIASGDYSYAFGMGSEALNQGAFVFGTKNTASGKYSLAMGYKTTASGDYSSTMGHGVIASGGSSFATGSYSVASGGVSTAMGYNTVASGSYSFAIGSATLASNYYSVAMGNNTISSGRWSTAMGASTTASGWISTAMGHTTTAQSYASVVLGRYNIISGNTTSWVATDPLFVIGNGPSTAVRSNAVTVLKNGNVGIGTATPVANLHVVGDATQGTVMIGPSVGSAADAELILCEDNDYSYGMSIKYDGDLNDLQVFGYSLGTSYGPHLSIDRNTGATWMPNVYGDAIAATYRDLYIRSDGQLGYIASSKRYKKYIKDMENINWLYDLRPVNFIYKTDKLKTKEYGLIAEEVEKINSSFVSYNEKGKVETVSYSKLVSPMLKALIEQRNINQKQEDKIISLEAEIKNIKSMLNQSTKK